MITTCAIIFGILWYKAKTKRDELLVENNNLKAEINRLNQIIYSNSANNN